MTEGIPEPRKTPSRGRRILRAAAVIGALAAPTVTDAREPQTSAWVATVEKEKAPEVSSIPPTMRLGDLAQPPIDFVNFCVRHPEECVPFVGSERERMTREDGSDFRRLELGDANAEVNALPQVSDLDRFGRTEHWTIADSKGGDCEDLAILKKRILQHVRGFQPNNLLLAHVLDEKNEGHIVLIVRMNDGDYVLDTKRREIALWGEYATTHGYTFLSRQSYLDPKVWRKVLPLAEQNYSRRSHAPSEQRK